ncbi:capsular polysaccharide synthesis protein [Psychrobacter sp. A3]|uniref:capsular polysaccharide synthesis protein n=1 Tax=Psychrobacter sp. A3 TaxID=2992754 RepID=UPI00237B661E|nr:capsular polysaccharide synthesis protein [Psychrobacter sp. A3]MDE0490993.1 capsular polysaccharide synthesis protein [Psychrobacter sp. A3]
MPNLVEDSPIDLNNISSHFFLDSEGYKQLKKKKKKPYRYLYNLTTPRSKRKALEKKVDIEQQNQVAKSWEAFIELYYNNKLQNFSLRPKKKFGHEKIIWQYWGQGFSESTLPDSVQLYFKSIDKHCADYKIIRLDDENIHEYLDLPPFVWNKKNLDGFKPAFFADLLRLALLDVYGGVWLDATIYLTAPLPNMLKDNDFFMYQRDQSAQNKQHWHRFNSYYFNWDSSHKVNLLNSVIFARKGNPVIHTCLDLLLNFWQTQEYIPHYFFFQILFDTLITDKLAQHQCAIVDDTKPHLLVSVLQKTFDKSEYQDIISQSSIHKMSYVKETKSGSYYEYLLNNT